MEDSYEVFQQHIRHDGRFLVIGCLLHVTVDDMLLPEGFEERIAGLGGFQGIVAELAGETVQYAPVVGIGSKCIHLLELQVLAGCLLVVDDIPCPRIPEYLRQIVLAPDGMPRPIVHLAAEDSRI